MTAIRKPWAMTQHRGTPCPENEAHGPLISVDGGLWYCPHAAHDKGPHPRPAIFTQQRIGAWEDELRQRMTR